MLEIRSPALAVTLLPDHEEPAKVVGRMLGCEVRVEVATRYTAEIEAMRNGKLKVVEFGPFGYVMGHQSTHADAVATFANTEGKPDTCYASMVTWPALGIEPLAQLRTKSFV